MQVLKDELDRQETLGIISKVHEPTAWCMPMFPREKKDGAIRTMHDFRWLNRAIRQRIHTMPKIEDLLFSIREYEYLTKIDSPFATAAQCIMNSYHRGQVIAPEP